MSSKKPVASDSSHSGLLSDFYPDNSIDLHELFARAARGIYQILGLTLLGLALGAISSTILSRVQPVSTSTRVSFSFKGFERGEYPDKSKFQADDLRAPAVITEALRRQGLDASTEFQSRIRGALSIEGITPPNITKERDRLRASGQTPPLYIPDDYTLTLSLPRSSSLGDSQRERLLREIVTVYRENFYRTYGQPPLAFGTAFETLKNADFPEYELVLNTEVDNIKSYLSHQIEMAGAFRSANSNLSFKDLLEQTDLFAQIQLNECLGIIHQNGLSRNRATAMLKMSYYVRLLEEREARAMEEEKVVRELLAQTQARAQNYVLGIKGQAAQPRSETPMLDQSLIDSLLANDPYNFLVRKALDAGLQVKRVQSEKARLIALRDNMKSFVSATVSDQSAIINEAERALKNLEVTYQKLIANVRKTHEDFSQQEYGNAIRLSDQVTTEGVLKPLVVSGLIGAFIGFALGAGLSLLGFYVGNPKRVA